MKKAPLIVGLELGTRHFIVAAGHVEENQRLRVRAAESIPTQGVERGVLSDPIECADSVARLIRKVEQSLSVKVPTVLAALPGNHLKSYNAAASVPISDPQAGISRRDVERVLTTCRTLSLDYDRQILHSFERGFSVDGQSGIKDPVGLCGTKLSVELHLVTALNLGLQNFIKVLNRAGLEVGETVLPGLATAEAVLSDLDKDLGVTLVRVGELQTEALLFTDGKIRETFLISWGTDHLTESISRAFKLSRALAEALLEQVRGFEERPEWTNTPLKVKVGSLARSFPQGQVIHLVRSKTKEFLNRLRGRLEESAYFRESAAGIVMLGGFARLEGFLEMAEGILNMPVRLGTTREVELESGVTLNSLHTTAVGLLRYAAARRSTSSSRPRAVPPALQWLDRARHLLEEYF